MVKVVILECLNAPQVSVQTGEDVAAAEAQTDQVGVAERWVQWPPEDLRGFGGGEGGEGGEGGGVTRVLELRLLLLMLVRKTINVKSIDS